MEQFDDLKLKTIARSFYYSGSNYDAEVDRLLDKKEKLSDSERNKLLSFIDKNKTSKPKSMGDMKRELLAMAGYKADDSAYGYNSAPVSRRELEVIYNFVKEKIK